MNYELILGIFTNDTESADALLERYHKSRDEVGIIEALAIVKTADGEDEVKIMGDPGKKSRRVGAVAGALLGVLGGPAAMVVMGAGGAAAGELIARLTHSGISKTMIEAIEQGLEPGSSAVVIIVEERAARLIIKDLRQAGAEVHNQSVDSDVAKKEYLISPSGGISENR